MIKNKDSLLIIIKREDEILKFCTNGHVFPMESKHSKKEVLKEFED